MKTIWNNIKITTITDMQSIIKYELYIFVIDSLLLFSHLLFVMSYVINPFSIYWYFNLPKITQIHLKNYVNLQLNILIYFYSFHWGVIWKKNNSNNSLLLQYNSHITRILKTILESDSLRLWEFW